MSTLAQFPHERRVQRFGFVALAASVVLAALQTRLDPAQLLTVTLPSGTPLGVVILGGIVGIVAILRRSPLWALSGAGVMLAGVASAPATGGALFANLIALAYGAATLGFVELVYVTQRYERAHRVVEKEHVPEEGLNRVTDETLKTLASRAGLAVLVVGAGLGLVHLLRVAGPRRWQEAVETTGPLGIAIATLTLFGAASLYILSRGGTLRAPPTPITPEVDSDVAE